MSAPTDESSPPRKVPIYRRLGATPRVARDLAFDRLPSAVRERLTRGLAHGAPDALVAAPSGLAHLAVRASLGTAVAAGVALLGVALRDLGAVYGERSLQPASYAAVYAALLATAALAAGGFVALRRFQRGAPFASGRYLFSLDLVEAEGGRLRVTSLDTLRAIEARPRQVAVVFEDGHEALFPAGKHDDPVSVAEQAQRAVAQAQQLAYPADQAKLERIDPFHEVRMTEDWAASADQGRRGLARIGWLAAAAVLAAAPAGYGLLLARNALSDDLMFEDAARLPNYDVWDKLRAYVAKGRRHLPEASALLIAAAGDDRTALRAYAAGGGAIGAQADDALFNLAKSDTDELARYVRRGGPRAAEADDALFATARRLDTLAAYNGYLEVGKLHVSEVEKEFLPEADFKQAARSPLVGSLFSFVRRYPGNRHEDEAWKLIRKAYAEALPAFSAAEQPPPAGLRFAEAMLGALLERADPRVTLDVRMLPPATVAQADTELAARYGALYLPAAGRFSERALGGLSSDIRDAVAGWFGRAFPRGVAEVARPSEDDGRPRFEIVCWPDVEGSSRWHKPGSTELVHVTPQVGFVVEVRGQVQRDGKETVLTWKLHLDDSTDPRVPARNFRGEERSPEALVADAFGQFLDGVPARIAASFHDKL